MNGREKSMSCLPQERQDHHCLTLSEVDQASGYVSDYLICINISAVE